MKRLMRLTVVTAALLLAGCEERQPPAGDAPPKPLVPVPGTQPAVPENPPAAKAAAEEPGSAEVDLTADSPPAGTRSAPAKPVLLEDFTPSGPLIARATHAYELISQLKVQIESIRQDLDNGGREITRLARTSDLLSKSITDLLALWPDDDAFRDACASAKRRALSLNEELTRVPRKWTYVRWTFSEARWNIWKLRVQARDLAEAEPKPLMVVDKKGNVTYVDPPPPAVDPAVARRQADLKVLEAARERQRKLEEQSKNKQMQIDLNDKSQDR